MAWIKEKEIIEFLKNCNYDIRITKNARWIDQKCTADVITIVADCIIQYVEEFGNNPFSSKDIWHSNYTVENVESFFKKPNLDEKKARNEYDKFFQQPMELLSYAGILIKYKKKNKNFYTINNKEIIEYLALREKNSLVFLYLYIEKVLSDSDIYSVFEDFFKEQTNKTYQKSKEMFTDFTIKNTPINGITESGRIFAKIMNPLAYNRNTRGTERGRLSKNKITYDMLMYNRENFRDLYSKKPKDKTRGQYEEEMKYKPNTNYLAYLSRKAKKFIRKFNDFHRNGETEVFDERHIYDKAINMHHMFPESDFPQICMYYENIIALTPTQHYSYAHPLGNTQKVDQQFQHISLIAKAATIKDNIENKEQEIIYIFDKFIFVLTIGFNNEVFKSIDNMDFDEVIQQINLQYR